MAFDFAAAKKQVRRTVHDTLSIAAEYDDADLAAPVPLRVRWHNKLTAVGDLDNTGYPMSIDTQDKVIFDMAELVVKNVTISRGGRLKITADGFGGQVLLIDSRDPKTGPIEEIWLVGKQNGEFNS